MGPATGCSSTRSSRSLVVCGTRSSSASRLRRLCTTAWSPSVECRSAASVDAALNAPCSSVVRRHSVVSSSSVRSAPSPPPLMPTVPTTGKPSSRDSASRSRCRPRARPKSCMFTATTHGSPSRLTLSTSRRLRRRLVASTTHTTRSGLFSPMARPYSTSCVTRSSGERGCRLYVPGKSSTRSILPNGVVSLPSLRSTVTPA